jgi:glutamyl-tRNA synthetase
VALIKDRCTLLPDFWAQGHFFFSTPELVEKAAISDKWNEQKEAFFTGWATALETAATWNQQDMEASFNEHATQNGLKKGDVMLPFRIMLVGGKYGPGVFAIAELIGKEETIKRIHHTIAAIKA